MPASEAQIKANQANAARSTGPKTPEGKARSRANAIKHGMAGQSAGVEAGRSPEFAERRAKWAAAQEPVGEPAHWALDRAVAASLQIDRCERALDELAASTRQRARLAWDLDREVEAATTFGRLARDPVLVSRQLQASLAGALLLVEAWRGLLSALEAGRDWSEAEASKALDLLGVAVDLRSARTLIDAPEGSDPVAFRREVVLEEVEQLEALAEKVLAPLDETERKLAVSGDLDLASKSTARLLRYERDAWRRYRESMKEVKAQAPPPPTVVAPALGERPRPLGRPFLLPSRSFRDERRALLAEVEALTKGAADQLPEAGPAAADDDDDWFDELERRIGSLPSATERTQFHDFAVGRGS